MEKDYKIMLVDDLPAHLEIMISFLEDDYSIIAVTNARDAIQLAKDEQPDLILLDIIMPEMDGYEACIELKKDKCTANIPIIFVTTKIECEEEAKGLELGAVDYVTKPFCPRVVKERIKTHLTILDQQRQLENSISLLEFENSLLAQRAELGIEASGLAHDMANILSSLVSLKYAPKKIPKDTEEWQGLVSLLNDSAETIDLGVKICRGFTSYLRGLGDSPYSQNLPSLLNVLDIYKRRYKGELVKSIADDIPPIICKGWQVKRVIVNLFVNAMQATEDEPSAKIEIRIWSDAGYVHLAMKDNGVGIPEEALPKIYDETFTTKEHGTGLGLFITKQIMDTHKGKLKVLSEQGKGAEVRISFPISH